MPSFIFLKREAFPQNQPPFKSTWADKRWLIVSTSVNRTYYIMQYHVIRIWDCAYRNSSHILFRGIEPGLLSFKFHSEKLTLFFSQQILVLCLEAPFGGWSQKHSLFFLLPARTAPSDEQCSPPEGDRYRRGINWGLFIRRPNRKVIFDPVFRHYPL